jgi:5-methylcytosine-specific restriction endonuclease McrA
MTLLIVLVVVLCGYVLTRPQRRCRRHSLRYRLYMRSPLWRIRRQIWIIRAGGRCQQCRSRRQLTIHHLTYARLGHERRADIAVLCWPCHQQTGDPRRGGGGRCR